MEEENNEILIFLEEKNVIYFTCIKVNKLKYKNFVI